MKIEIKDPPRRFQTGRNADIELADCGRIALKPNEFVTFTTPDGGEYDLARKDWGFYATPSLNGRLKDHNLRAVLVKSPINRFFVFLVEAGKEPLFQQYIDTEKHVIVSWLDSDEALGKLEASLARD